MRQFDYSEKNRAVGLIESETINVQISFSLSNIHYIHIVNLLDISHIL